MGSRQRPVRGSSGANATEILSMGNLQVSVGARFPGAARKKYLVNAGAHRYTIFRDPEHIVRWGWNGRGKIRQRVIRAETDQPHLRVVRLRTPRDVELWLHTLSTAR